MEHSKILMTFLIVVLIVNKIILAEQNSLHLIKDKEFLTFFKMARSSKMKMSDEAAWKKYAPEVVKVSILSSEDSSMQSALFYNPKSPGKKPLLVALHSWSEDYEQKYSIPYALWCVSNDWVMIHPDFRGTFTKQTSTGSELTISDIMDAVEYAKVNAQVDTSRIYLIGFSGGGMMTLIMVGRYPDVWAGASAWVPIYDLVEWYGETKNAVHDYSKHIINSCGGAPLPGTTALDECAKRSVKASLKNARNKNVKVLIATGIQDVFVAPSHSMLAFNDLAEQVDMFSPDQIEFVKKNLRLPKSLTTTNSDKLFTNANLPLIYERSSANVTIKIFNGNHDIVYNAGLLWLSDQRK